MDLEQANRELGLEAGVDVRAVKRAYLRAVKAHPPEQDPDGFRRVREAYELLCASRLEPCGESIAVQSAFDIVVGATSNSVPECEADRWIEELSAPGVDAERATEICSRAMASASGSEGVVRALSQTLAAIDLHEQASDILVEAYRRGLSGLAIDVLRQCPSRLALDELKALAIGNDPTSRLAAIGELCERGAVLSAASAMQKLYAANIDHANCVPVPAPAPAVATAFALIQRGRFKRAQRLLDSLDQWLATHAVRMDSATSARHALCRDLVALVPRLPKPVVKDLAGAVHEGELERVGQLVASGEENYQLFVEARIRRYAPMLHQTISPFLQVEQLEQQVEPPARRGRMRGAWWLFVTGFMLLRLIAECGQDRHHGMGPVQRTSVVALLGGR